MTTLKKAFGGVVMNAAGQVLLKEPTNHFDAYVWTFPKGRPNPGESPETTALREVREETGVEARIIASIRSRRDLRAEMGELQGGRSPHRDDHEREGARPRPRRAGCGTGADRAT